MRSGIAAVGLVLIFIFGILFVWAFGVHDPIYQNGVYVGYRYIKQEVIATFAGLAILGGCVFVWGLVAVSPDEEARKLRATQEAIKQVVGSEHPVLLCSVCGGPLKEDYLICPSCGTVYKKKCPQCNRVQPSGFKVCPYCGYKFDQETER